MRGLERLAWRSAQAACLVVAALGGGLVLTEPATASGTVAYRLAWDTTGVERLTDGTWRYVTVDGVEVVVTVGALTTRSVTLAACPHDDGLLARIRGLVATAPAAANHGSTVDALAVDVVHTEDLVALEASEVASTTTSNGEPSYCEAHSAVAGGSAADRLSGASAPTLHLEGTVDGAPFAVDTDVAWGWTTTLAAGIVIDDAQPATVTLVRSAAALADAVAARGSDASLLRALEPVGATSS